MPAEPVPSFGDLIGILEAQERQLSNIRVDFDLWREQRIEGSDRWDKTPEMSKGVAYFDGSPGGRARIERVSVCRWEDGAAAYGENEEIVASNGKERRFLQLRVGPYGQTFRTCHAQIASEGTSPLVAEFAAGQSFSIYYFHCYHRRSLSGKLIEALGLAKTHPFITMTVTPDVIDGRDVLQVRIAGVSVETIWLDPDRGYAVLQCRSEVPSRNIVQWEYRIHEVVNAAPNIWYPISATVERLFRKDANVGTERYHYKALSVVANDPNWDDSVFTLQFPPLTAVDDKIRGTTYVVPGPIRTTDIMASNDGMP